MSARAWTPEEDAAIARLAGGWWKDWHVRSLARDLGRHRAELRRRRRRLRRSLRRALGLGGGRA